MKVTVTPKAPAPEYPKVMQHKDAPTVVVLFIEAGRGICISPESSPDFGKISNAWVNSGWKACCVILDSTGE